MKIIDPSVTVVTHDTSLDPLKSIELAGRVCYKSEDKISHGSAEQFVKAIISRGHEAVLEHGSFIFSVDTFTGARTLVISNRLFKDYGFDAMIRITDCDGNGFIMSGNVRAWRDFFRIAVKHGVELPAYVGYLAEKYPIFFEEFATAERETFEVSDFREVHAEELHPNDKMVHNDITLRFICDRGVSHELVRHRKASYCQESTRYCNYSGEKFGGEITVIRPCFLAECGIKYAIWASLQEKSEEAYLDLLRSGASPQEARTVLSNSLKTEVVMTTNRIGWKHFIELRNSPKAHPQMQQVAKMAQVELFRLA